MEGRKKTFLMSEVATMVVILLVECASCDLHKVGGSKGWLPNFNYTDWSNQEQVLVGDWLLFVFDKHMYNVLEVNKTSYETCNDQGFIKNITKGGRDVVQLTEARPYYYLSSGGYCWGGMKVSIFVQEIPPSPAPAPTKSGSPISTFTPSTHHILLSTITSFVGLACFVMLKY